MEPIKSPTEPPSPPNMHEPWRVLVVDAHALSCTGVAMMLRTMPEVAEVAVATYPDQALRIANYFRPHMALVDFTMPERGGLETARRLLASPSHCRVVFLDNEVHHAHVREVLRLGVSGYWTRHATFDEIAGAVGHVIEGRESFCPAVEQHLIRTPGGRWYRPNLVGTPLESLTPRELEVLVHLSDGLTVKQCAARMKLVESTINAYRARLMRKLNVRDIVELAKLVARQKLVEGAHGYQHPATEG